jgi:hypothetical protein
VSCNEFVAMPIKAPHNSFLLAVDIQIFLNALLVLFKNECSNTKLLYEKFQAFIMKKCTSCMINYVMVELKQTFERLAVSSSGSVVMTNMEQVIQTPDFIES